MGYSTSDFSGLRVPDEDAADDVAADFSYLVEQIDPKLIGDADSTAERDSKFFNAPADFVARVTNSEDDSLVGIYVKTDAPGIISWSTLYEPTTDLVEQPLELPANFEQRNSDQTPSFTQEDGNFASLGGAVIKTDATQINSGETVGYLPTGVTAFYTFRDFPVAVPYVAGQTGASRVSINSGTRAINYWGPSVDWVNLSGIRFRTL